MKERYEEHDEEEIQEFEPGNWDIEDDDWREGEIFISPDGERIIWREDWEAEIEYAIDNHNIKSFGYLTREEFKFLFKDWIKVGNL